MYIKDIFIKNMKSIKEVKIDLSPNKNGIEKNIKNDQFKLIDNKLPIPYCSVLVGRNSIGKTTIIESISLISDFINQFIQQKVMSNIIRKENEKINAKQVLHGGNLIPSVKEQEEINNKMIEINNEFRKSLSEKKGIFYERYLLGFREWVTEYFISNAFDKNEDIYIKLTFVDKQNKMGDVEFIMNNNGEINYKEKGDFKKGDIQKFLSNSMFPDRTYRIGEENLALGKPHFTSSNFHKNDLLGMAQIIINLLGNIGEEKLVKLLKLADDSIDDIKYTKHENKQITIKGIILKNGGIVLPVDLSSGTKQFLIYSESILRMKAIAKKDMPGILVIDEIEVNMHKELVQSLFLMLRMFFKNYNIQSIVTTHNVHFLAPEISTKQIFSISKEENMHKVEKISSFMKEHESIIKKYDKGWISPYPDPFLMKNTISEIVDDE